nr:hypothetical protein [uncultured bacterium]
MKINRKITGVCTHDENEEASIKYCINASYEEKWKVISALREFFFGEKAINCIVNKNINGIRELNT